MCYELLWKQVYSTVLGSDPIPYKMTDFREFSFFGETALEEFVIWLAYTKENSGAICFCHYGG